MNIKYLKIPGSIRRLFSLAIFLCIFTAGFSQEIHLNVNNLPLNKALVLLRDSYGLKFSFDDQLLSGFRVTVKQTFPSAGSALDYLLAGLPVLKETVDGVYLIYPAPDKGTKALKPRTVIYGLVKDATNGEPLPFSHLYVNRHGIISDAQGRYSFVADASPNGTAISVQVSYLGYYQLDTALTATGEHDLGLTPSVVGIQEVAVVDKPRILSTISGSEAGEIRLNHQVGSYLPGFADNSVYNLLRLQPGVLAAAEQANDLIIRGSYPGQTSVLFDGFLIYGLKNFDDNIGVVNPLMVKDIRLMKGGYPANYESKAGGIVDITGISGNRKKTEFDLSLTNLTLNTRLSVPVAQRAAVTLAFRQTFYNLYSGTLLDSLGRNNGQGQELVDFSVTPDYTFSDFNFKFAGITKGGDSYYIDYMTGRDRFKYLADFQVNNKNFSHTSDERNTQTGASFFYGRIWDRGNTTKITLSYSGLAHQSENQTNVETRSAAHLLRRHADVQNDIGRFSVSADNQFSLNPNHTLEFGFGLERHQILMSEDSLGFSLFEDSWKSFSLSGYVQDRLSCKNGINILAGVRVETPFLLGKTLVQPRISLNYQMADGFWLKAAIGKYDQYVVQSSLLDEDGNYRYFWVISDGRETAVQSAGMVTAGITYQRKKFSFGVEAYYKKMTGLNRYIKTPNLMGRDIFTGKAFSQGLDFLVEGKFGRHSAWLGYTLSRTMENFSYFLFDRYVRAPQDQRHEVKAAALFNFHPFYFSTNYVYGSGFPDRSLRLSVRQTTDVIYSRWDISGFYQFRIKRLNIQSGISILNLLNAENIKLQNFVKIPNEAGSSVNILAEAVPFTPTLFLVLKF